MTEEAPNAAGQVDNTAPAGQGQAEPSETWYTSAPDEVKGYIQNKGWDDPLKVVNSYQELEKFNGVGPDRLIKLPKDGEPMDAVYDRLGRPESADKYEWSPSDDAIQVDDGRLSLFKEHAHKLGLNQAQFKALVDMDAQYSQEFLKTHLEEKHQKQEIDLKNLQKEWGENFDERAELGRRFVRSNLPEGLNKEETLTAIEDAIGTANMLKFFANAYEKSGLKEDSIPNSGGDRPYGYTKEQAAYDRKALMSELSSDPARLAAYNKGKGTDYDKMERLLKILSS